MPAPKGKLRESTLVFHRQIVESLAKEPKTYKQLMEEFGVTYKTMFGHISTLAESGQVSIQRRRQGADLIQATKVKNIPHLPGATESFNPMRIVLQIRETKGKYKSKLEQLDEKWGMTITGILRTSVVIQQEDKFPADRHKEYETYLRMYREELAFRLQQVNALLQTDKFWTEEGLRDFPNDPAYSAAGILEAWQYCLSAEKKDE